MTEKPMIEKEANISPVLINIIVMSGSLLLIMLVLELYLRAQGFNPFAEFFEQGGRAVFIQPSDNKERLFEATPNALGKGWGTDIQINSAGFRGREYSLEKPEDTYRVAVLGDSIAFGNNLPATDNFPSILEQRFSSIGKNVEVLNLALGGYDTLQEVATLEDIGLAFKPDMVVLAYCLNDIGIASGNVNYIKRLQKYGKRWIYHFRLAQFVRIQLDRIELKNYGEEANKEENFYETYKNYFADIDDDDELKSLMVELLEQAKTTTKKHAFTLQYASSSHIKRLRYSLEKLKRLQKQNGFKVVVLILPFLIEDDESRALYQSVYKIVEHEVKRLELTSLNFYKDFKDKGLKTLMLRKDDGIHPNKKGHELVSDELFNKINQKIKPIRRASE